MNMADAVARREARIKKILQNSENRLQFISGKCSENAIKESTIVSPIPHHYENTIETITTESSTSKYSVANGELEAETISFETLLSRHDIAAGDSQISADLISQPSPNQQFQSPLWKTVITYKYDVVLLSLVLQLLYSLSTNIIQNTYLFVPLIIYGVTKKIWLPEQYNSSITNVLMLLNGMSPNIHKVLNILNWISVLGQDACVYLFTTICTQSFLNFIRDNFVT